jgi:hypothetical protein
MKVMLRKRKETSKMKSFFNKIKSIFFPRKRTLNVNRILNPPSWRERQVQNQKIEEDFEKNLKAKGKEAHWSDKYDKDFKKMKKEVVRVRENG